MTAEKSFQIWTVIGGALVSAVTAAVTATWIVSSTFATKAELDALSKATAERIVEQSSTLRNEIQTTAPFARREREIDSRLETVSSRLEGHENRLLRVLEIVTENRTQIGVLVTYHKERGNE